MNERTKQLLDRLEQEHALALEEYAELLLNRTQQAAAYAAHAREVKAKGGKWCDCPACAPGREILDRKEELC